MVYNEERKSRMMGGLRGSHGAKSNQGIRFCFSINNGRQWMA